MSKLIPSDLMEERKYLHKFVSTGELTTDSLKDISIDSSGSRVIFTQQKNNKTVQTGVGSGIDNLRYDLQKKRVVSDKGFETTLSSLFLREQHKMASGGQNVFFKNLGSNINFSPVFQGLRDQSVISNQDKTGIVPPTLRQYSNNIKTHTPTNAFITPIATNMNYVHTLSNNTSMSSITISLIDNDFDLDTSYIEMTIYNSNSYTRPSVTLELNGSPQPTSATGPEIDIFQQDIYLGNSSSLRGFSSSKFILDATLLTVIFTHPFEEFANKNIRIEMLVKEVVTGKLIGNLRVESVSAEDTNPFLEFKYRTFEDKELIIKEDFENKLKSAEAQLATLLTQ